MAKTYDLEEIQEGILGTREETTIFSLPILRSEE